MSLASSLCTLTLAGVWAPTLNLAESQLLRNTFFNRFLIYLRYVRENKNYLYRVVDKVRVCLIERDIVNDDGGESRSDWRSQ